MVKQAERKLPNVFMAVVHLLFRLFRITVYLSLEPMTTDIDLRGALSKGNIRVAVPSTLLLVFQRIQKL